MRPRTESHVTFFVPRLPYLVGARQSGVHMDRKSDPRRRARGNAPVPVADSTPGTRTLSWEEKALSSVRSHVRELSGPGAAQAGWETDTITRLEDYFDLDQV